MARKALFLIVVAVWLSWRAVPTARVLELYCGDGICQTGSCAHSPGDPGNGCEENAGNCLDCAVDPCDSPSNPTWVADWGTDQAYGAFESHGFDGQSYCEIVETHVVTEHDYQACVAYREADRSVCWYYTTPHRLYYPNDYSCCATWGCGGTGPNCP